MRRLKHYSLLILLLSLLLPSCDSYENWKAEGLAFLETQKADPTTLFTPEYNGQSVPYHPIKQVAGARPMINDYVEVKYKLSYFNGQVLEEPSTAVVMRAQDLIVGVKTALLYMPLGSKWRLFLHWDQAYGASGSGSTQYYYNMYGYPSDYQYVEKIKPYSVLIFELELIKNHGVTKPATTK